MGWWEETALFSHANPYRAAIKWYGRSIDDLILVWDSTVMNVVSLVSYMDNSLNLEFSMESHFDTIDFTLVGNITSREINTHTFRKECAGNSLQPVVIQHTPCDQNLWGNVSEPGVIVLMKPTFLESCICQG